MTRLALVAAALAFSSPVAADPQLSATPIEVCFVPGTGCQDLIVQHIDAAKTSVFAQAYSFTSSKIAEALVRAKARGVDVRVILDRSDLTGKGTQLRTLVDGKVPTWIDSAHAISHNKVLVLDGVIVQTGSYNLTGAAERSNAENAVFIHDAALAKQFFDNWVRHVAHSVPAT